MGRFSCVNPNMPPPPPPLKGPGPHGGAGNTNPKLQVQPATPVPPSSSGATPVPGHRHLASVPEEKAQLPRIVPSTHSGSSSGGEVGGRPTTDNVVGSMGPPQMLPPGHAAAAASRGLHSSGSSSHGGFGRFHCRTIKQGPYRRPCCMCQPS